MVKKWLVFCCVMAMSFFAVLPVSAISNDQKTAIVKHCESIKDDLREIQKSDARLRVHLGGRYETILSKFIMPLNIRLVENNLSSPKLVENQNKFAEAKVLFNSDYIVYQQALEELVATDCKKSPEVFYEKLVTVRQKRKVMERDVMNLRTLISQHVKLVKNVEGKIDAK